jgi:ABC-type transport system involved in multi-copper enzyme maturation permease subunit
MSIRGVLILSVALILLGWFTLGSFTYYNPPSEANRLIALAILWPTLIVTLLLPAFFINLRLRSDGKVVLRATRQSALVALFLTLCVWLRMIQSLSWTNAIVLLGLLGLTEVLLSARES